MPTYRSLSGEIQAAAGITFKAFETKELKTYLGLDKYPFLVKVSDAPESYVLKEFTPIFIPFNMSQLKTVPDIFTFDNCKSIVVRDDWGSNDETSTITIQFLGGLTDNPEHLIPYDYPITFNRTVVKLKDGNNLGIWGMKLNVVDLINAFPNSKHSVMYPFFSITVLSADLVDDVEIYVRTIRNTTPLMI